MDDAAADRAWRLAATVPGNDPAQWRKDEFGAWMAWHDYGRRDSEFGWELADFSQTPGQAHGLRAVQWQNHVDHLLARRPVVVTADGLRNSRRLLP